MKQWQKVSGIIALAVLAIINSAVFLFHLQYSASIYILPGVDTHEAIETMRIYYQNAILEIGYLVLANYLIIVLLFIYLWQKVTMFASD